jgi:hypothetical protein
MGLAIEQAAHGQPVEDRAGQLQDKTDHLKQVLRPRLASLIKRRRRIEALKSRVQAPQTPAVLERLQATLCRREKAYQERLVALRRGRRKLARWQKELRGLQAQNVGVS